MGDMDDGRVQFYYSRANRLKKASQAVRDLNNGVHGKKKGLFKTLTATPAQRFTLLSIIIITVMLIALSRFYTAANTKDLGNNSVTALAVTTGENSYLTVKKTARTVTAYSGSVDIAVSLPGEGSPFHVEKIYFGPEKEEEFRFIVPFTGKKLLILMEAGANQALFTLSL